MPVQVKSVITQLLQSRGGGVRGRRGKGSEGEGGGGRQEGTRDLSKCGYGEDAREEGREAELMGRSISS